MSNKEARTTVAEGSATASVTDGFDSAKFRREHDDLDRWRLAKDIADVVITTPPEWSARIGVFGKWGEGKSTVLHFAEQLLKAEDNIVFLFNPWAVQNWNDLWGEFGDRLTQALELAGIPIETSWTKLIRKSKKWADSSGTGGVAKSIVGIWGGDKIVEASFAALGHWLKYDGPQIRAIRHKLGNRRVVVLIDDLDRCDASLLPRLLLSLRELLDLPGFTFLLAFDDEIVATALVNTNPAWAQGTNFLEKIIDFRFPLPPISERQRQRLTLRAMEQFCPFVPQESTQAIEDLLPHNPRKLKSLIRSLAAIRPQLARHDPDELKWKDIWLAQMLRMESDELFQRLAAKDLFDQELGVSFRLFGRDKSSEERKKALRQLVTSTGICDERSIERLEMLIEAIRSRSSIHFSYACELVVRPHAVTWKEFRQLMGRWSQDSRPQVIDAWLARHADEISVEVDDVEDEVFDSALGRRNERLSEAAESSGREEHGEKLQEARDLLRFCIQFLTPARATATRLERLTGQANYWIGFRRNEADETLREEEKAALIGLFAASDEGTAEDLLTKILPRDWEPEFDANTSKLRSELRATLYAIIAPIVARKALTLLQQDGGIRSLYERGRLAGVKHCLFSAESPIWTGSLEEELMGILRSGAENRFVFNNIEELLEIIPAALQAGSEIITREEAMNLIQRREFIAVLWGTAVSRGIQYRMQQSYLSRRDLLIKNGVPAHALPLSDELERRRQELAVAGSQLPAGRKAETGDHLSLEE